MRTRSSNFTPNLGRLAPPFAIRSTAGATLFDLDRLRGKPCVLACIPDWHHGLAGSGAMSAVRAELRTLGAALVLVSRRGVLCFYPDADIQRCVAADVVDSESVCSSCAQYGV